MINIGSEEAHDREKFGDKLSARNESIMCRVLIEDVFVITGKLIFKIGNFLTLTLTFLTFLII